MITAATIEGAAKLWLNAGVSTTGAGGLNSSNSPARVKSFLLEIYSIRPGPEVRGHWYRQLEKSGLLKKNEMAVDATVIASSRRPRKKVDMEIVVHERHEDEVG